MLFIPLFTTVPLVGDRTRGKMGRRTQSPDPRANKRIKLDSPARELAARNNLEETPFYAPLRHYNSPGPIYNSTPPPDNTLNMADVELQLKVAQL